ncbi:hypothetical protein JTB14_012358 [Gonioctena quinquepunctata]|nr:hypothetical protein JTB14_012358 [Gonioctena quinquepunctata]
MAAGVDVSVSRELDKLRKAELIEIIINNKLSESVTSDVLCGFFKNRSNTTAINNPITDKSEAKLPKHGCDVLGCDKQICLRSYFQLDNMMMEKVHLQEKIGLLKNRTADLECIMSILNQDAQKTPTVASKPKEMLTSNQSKISTPSIPAKDSTIGTKYVQDEMLPANKNHETSNTLDWNLVTYKNSSRKKADDHAKNNRHMFELGEVDQATKKAMKAVGNPQQTNYTRRHHRKPIVGVSKTVSTVKTITKLGYLHVYRLSPDTTPEDQSKALAETAPEIPFTCEQHYKNEKTCSMLVKFPIDHVKDVYNPQIWPAGAMVNRYQFPNNANFF